MSVCLDLGRFDGNFFQREFATSYMATQGTRPLEMSMYTNISGFREGENIIHVKFGEIYSQRFFVSGVSAFGKNACAIKVVCFCTPR